MTHLFKLQDPGEGIHEVEIHEILVSVGDRVEEGQDVFVVESDKAAIEIPAPESGTVEKINVSEGDIVTVGEVLMEIGDAETAGPKDTPEEDVKETNADDETEETEEAEEAETKARPQKTSGKQAAAKASASPPKGDKKPAEGKSKPNGQDRQEKDEEAGKQKAEAVPAARKLAQDRGIDLSEIEGTGSQGQITRRDVEKALEGEKSEADKTPHKEERIPLRSIRRATAKQMSRAWAEIPHVTHQDSVDITDLEAGRLHLNRTLGEDAPKLTLTAFVLKALAILLPRHPRFNACLDTGEQEIVQWKHYDIAVAVDTERGLMTPVLRNVDRQSILAIARALDDLSDKAREGTASRDDLSGGTFTLTNVGGLGGTAFTPIINHPQAAILGLAKARMEPVIAERNGVPEVIIRLMLPLVIAFDHRLLDGADAARFINDLKELLSHPARLLVELR